MPTDFQGRFNGMTTERGAGWLDAVVQRGPLTLRRIGKYLRVASLTTVQDEHGILANDDSEIGVLKYYPRWKQWVLIPGKDTVWSHECLEAIRQHLVTLNGELRSGGEAP